MTIKTTPLDSKINKLFGSAYLNAPTTNGAGAPAFIRSDEEALLRVLTTGTFENTFYVDGKDLAKEALDLFREFVTDDPQYLAQAILYARNEGFMRLAPITALVVLSTAEDKTHFQQIFSQVIQTPGDLQDFISLCRLRTLRGMGKAVQHAAQRWLANISEYHVIKYGSENQTMSLRDMYRIARPKLVPGSKANSLARYVVKGDVPNLDLPQIMGYEQFKSAAREHDKEPTAEGFSELMRYVDRYRLPWEVVTSQVQGTTELWSTMMRQMPYMALLRNLNNLKKYGVTNDTESLQYIVDKLTNPEAVAKSKQLPFRFVSARKALDSSSVLGEMDTGNSWWGGYGGRYKRVYQETSDPLVKAIDTALELSFKNMPNLGGSVLLANDVSGSMQRALSDKSQMTYEEIAAVLCAAGYKRSENAKIVSFDGNLYERKNISPSMSLMEIARSILGYGGSTDLSLPIRYALSYYAETFDTGIFVTDSESWLDHLTRNRGLLDEVRDYRRKRNPNFNLFLIQIVSNRTAQVPQNEPGVYYLYGWSDKVLSFISSVVSGGQNQVEYVRNLPLVKVARPENTDTLKAA